MTDSVVEALRHLVQNHGGAIAVADKIGVNDQTIYQILKGVLLPSGRPKGVGPKLRAKLDEHFPGWLTAPIAGQSQTQLGPFSAQDGASTRRQMIDAIAAGHQSPLTLERALSVVLDALADLPPARAASVRAQLDLVRQHPEMKSDVLAELLNLLTEPSKGRIAA